MQIDNFALIIGTMKGGTTSLFNYLAEHPQVSPCKEKEPSFFSERIMLDRGYNYYQSLWDYDSSIHKIALEASTSYTRATHPYYLKAAENIYRYSSTNNIKFKFIYILRNPLERIESHYTHGRAWGFEETKKSLTEEINREVIETTKYAMQIEEYYQKFPANSILLLNFEDLKQKPQLVLKKICQFLEIDDTYNFNNLNIHNKGQARTTIKLPGWYKIRTTKSMKALSTLIPVKQKKIFRSFFGRKVNEHIKLSPEQRKLVLTELQPDLEKLRSQYDFDTSQWNLSLEKSNTKNF